VEAAAALVAEGAAEHVVLTLGAEGAVLVSAGEVLHLVAPPVKTLSTVGAGDSLVAGIVLRLAQGRPIAAALRAGVAAGTAAVMTPGTQPCRREDMERIEKTLTAQR
jgi:6-phosphofructokinase 2